MASDGRTSSYTHLADNGRPSEWLEKQQSGSRRSKLLVCRLRLCLVYCEAEWVGCWAELLAHRQVVLEYIVPSRRTNLALPT